MGEFIKQSGSSAKERVCVCELLLECLQGRKAGPAHWMTATVPLIPKSPTAMEPADVRPMFLLRNLLHKHSSGARRYSC